MVIFRPAAFMAANWGTVICWSSGGMILQAVGDMDNMDTGGRPFGAVPFSCPR